MDDAGNILVADADGHSHGLSVVVKQEQPTEQELVAERHALAEQILDAVLVRKSLPNESPEETLSRLWCDPEVVAAVTRLRETD